MRSRVRIQMLAAVAVVALAFGAGCGDNDNNDNTGGPVGSTRTPTPGAVTRTPTPGPVATSTPGTGGTTNVTLAFSAASPLSGYQVDVTYPVAQGNFAADATDATQAACSSAGNDSALVARDDENGKLTLVAGAAGALTFPDTVTCTFNGTVGGSNLQPTVREVTKTDGTVGNAADLTVTASTP